MEQVTVRVRALKHVRVREQVREMVAHLAPGDAVPSERDLVGRFGVARMTVRQAIDALVVEGLLERSPGRGTFLAQPRPVTENRPTSFTEDVRRRGMLPESQTLQARREQAGPGVARALGLSPGDSTLHWRRLRRADQRVVCVEDAWLNEVLLPGFLQQGMPTSLYDALAERGLRPTWAEDSVRADVATDEELELLELRQGTPVLRVSRRARAGDLVVEVSRSVYRADGFTLYHQVGTG